MVYSKINLSSSTACIIPVPGLWDTIIIPIAIYLVVRETLRSLKTYICRLYLKMLTISFLSIFLHGNMFTANMQHRKDSKKKKSGINPNRNNLSDSFAF